MRSRLIAGVLLLVIIISVLYVFFGNNWLAEQQYNQKEKNQDFVRNDLRHSLLELQDQSEDIINQLLSENYEMDLIPQKDVALELQPLFKTENELSLNPQFDLKFIYLVMGNKLAVYSKINFELEWELYFEKDITSLSLLDANSILVHTSEGRLVCMNREQGRVVWEKPELESMDTIHKLSAIREISLSKYHQLDSSIILVPGENQLTLLSSINGTEITKIDLDKKVDFISKFDQFEKCVYLSSDKDLSRLTFKISH